MACKQFFINNDNKLINLSLLLISVGLIANFITTIIWWLRINPWLLHSKHPGKFVNLSTFICWILSLVDLLLIAILFVFKKKFKSQLKNTFTFMICLCSLISFILGIAASFFALRNEKVSLGKFGKLNNKCYSYVLQYNSIKEWAVKNGKVVEFEAWYKNLINKISNCKSSDCDHKNPYNEYLCLEVGIPTLVFAIVQVSGIILFMITYTISSKESKDRFLLFENEQN